MSLVWRQKHRARAAFEAKAQVTTIGLQWTAGGISTLLLASVSSVYSSSGLTIKELTSTALIIIIAKLDCHLADVTLH
jgi:hypothetical protein